MKTKKKKGFTLTELIVVIVIIGVLAAVMIPTLSGYITKAKNSKDETLVASLNRNLENTMIMEDDLKFYTAYDVQAYLESVDMKNIEVSNKENLILFDTEINEFVLIKENEQNEAFYVEKTVDGNKVTVLNNEGELILNPMEYYKINHSFYDEDDESLEGQTLSVMRLNNSKLSNKKCTENNCTAHRAFIVSKNGNEISEAVSAFMQINDSMETKKEGSNEYLIDSIRSVFTKQYKDSQFKEILNNSLSKTLFVGKNKTFYIDSNYQIVSFTGTSKEGQPLTRPVILSNVDEINLSYFNNLEQSTIIIPGTVNYAKSDNISDSIDLSGNYESLDNGKENSNYVPLDEALVLPLIKELITATTYVSSEGQLNEILKCYKEIDSGEILEEVKKSLNLNENDEKYKKVKKNFEKLKTKISKTITIVGNFTVESKEPIDIPVGVKLLIPYNSSYKENSGKDETYGSLSKIHKTIGSTEEYDVEGYRAGYFKELTIGNDVEINVFGEIVIGGVTGNVGQGLEGHTSGAYGQLTLLSGSKLNIKSTGVLNVYGYVLGEGEITTDYNKDTGEGATINEPFIVGDFAGGSKSALLSGAASLKVLISDIPSWVNIVKVNLNANDLVAPFSQYGISNIQTNMKIVYGASLNGIVKIWMYPEFNTNNDTPLPLISKSDSFIKMTNENDYVLISYLINDKITYNNNSFKNIGQSKIDIYGSIETGEIKITVPYSSSIEFELSSNDFLLPIPYTFLINFMSGSSEIKTDLALLPGSEFTVYAGAELTIGKGSKLFVIDKLIVNNTDGTTSFTSSNEYEYPCSSPSKLVINGTLNINGTFGGIIQTTSRTGSIIVADDAILSGIAKFGCGTKEFSVANIITLEYGSTSTMNNYELVGKIFSGDELINLEKGAKYQSAYNNDTHKLNDEVTCYIAGEVSEYKVTSFFNFGYKWEESSSAIKRDEIEVCGNWEVYHKVTFNVDGGSTVAEQYVLHNGYVEKPDDPTKTSGNKKVFKGWYKDNSKKTFWDFAIDKVTSSVTIYAKWE